MFKYKIGAEVSDKVSGFKGIITGRCQWISGIISYEITAKVTDPSKRPEPSWISENMIQLEGQDAQIVSKTLAGEEVNVPVIDNRNIAEKRPGFM